MKKILIEKFGRTIDLLNPPDELLLSLDERRKRIKEFDDEMDFICSSLKYYVESIRFATQNKLVPAYIVNHTYNLLLSLKAVSQKVSDYDYMKKRYILDDDYDTAYRFWLSFSQSTPIIKNFVKSIGEESFDYETAFKDHLCNPVPASFESIDVDTQNLHIYLYSALQVGMDLFSCLNQSLDNLERWFDDNKRGYYLDEEEDPDYDRVYELNKKLYMDTYWERDREQFRLHLLERNLHRPITVDFLERMLWQDQNTFENSQETGSLYKMYHNRKDFYYEAKRIKLNEEQWKNFFKTICCFEEYAHWIEELRNPPKSNRGLRAYVVKPEIAEEVVRKISELIQNETKPKSIVRPIRAAMDAGVMHRPTWEAFFEEYGKQRIKSSTSFNSYTNPEQDPYSGPSYNTLVDEFRRFLPE